MGNRQYIHVPVIITVKAAAAELSAVQCVTSQLMSMHMFATCTASTVVGLAVDVPPLDSLKTRLSSVAQFAMHVPLLSIQVYRRSPVGFKIEAAALVRNHA